MLCILNVAVQKCTKGYSMLEDSAMKKRSKCQMYVIQISYILYHTHHQCRHTRILLKIDTHGISDVCVSTSIVLAWIPAIENMMYIYEKYVKYNERFTHH